MDVYHIWCNLKDGVKDTDFAQSARAYLDYLESSGLIAGYRITRRKLGLGPQQLPEFHVTLECEGMAQLDQAFNHVATRVDPVEGFHRAVNSKVRDALFALYRDFPDAVRVQGEEQF